MSLSTFQDLTAEAVLSRSRATDANHLMRKEQIEELLTAKSSSAHTHAQLHDALTLHAGIQSITGALVGQELDIEVHIPVTGSGLLIDATGLYIDFGTGVNQAARGNHTHANDHVLAAADPVQANGITVSVNGSQQIKATPVLSTDGGLAVDGTGLYVDFGTGNAQAARGDHSHAEATTLAAGLMSAVDKAKLDSMSVFDEHTYDDSNTVDFTGPTLGVVTASVRLHTGLLESIDGIEVDFTVVATAGHTHDLATQEAAGLMSAADKLKLDTLIDAHDPVQIDEGNLSIQASLDNQTLSLEVALAIDSGMMITVDGLELEYGSDDVHPARGDHVHANDHVLATAGTDTNTIAVLVTGQAITASVRVSTGGGLSSDATGLFCDFGTGSAQVATGNHVHAEATTGAAGFMSAADKTKLDGIGTPENALTFEDTASINFTRAVDTITADLNIGTGLKLEGNSVAVDFTQVAAENHIHTVATGGADGFMAAADYTLLQSLPDQTDNDGRYPRFTTGDPTDIQYIQSIVRIPQLIIGSTGSAGFVLTSSIVRANPDLKINRYLYLSDSMALAPGILMVDGAGLVRCPGADESFRSKDGNLQLWDDVTNKYHPVWLHNGILNVGAGEL